MKVSDTIKQLFDKQKQLASKKSIKIQDIDRTKVDGVINDAKKFDDAVRGPADARGQRTDRKN
jgi:hypothetical protein